ncbi:MAG TPA: hypothetical protein VFP88_02225 [Rhodanobacteraceae bacterium]|nr:hypothetical protein [Rhodanobacteraceae bacterium]
MKKLILATALIAAAGMGGVAVAQTSADVAAATTAQVAAGNPVAASDTHARQVPAPGSRNCVRETGSHLPPPKGGCLPVNGTSYSRTELERTG